MYTNFQPDRGSGQQGWPSWPEPWRSGANHKGIAQIRFENDQFALISETRKAPIHTAAMPLREPLCGWVMTSVHCMLRSMRRPTE